MPPEDRRYAFASERAAMKVIDGDAIVIDTVTGRYYSLEGTGEAAWSLLTASLALHEVAEQLARRYEAGDADVLADVTRLADQLVEENLLIVSDAQPATVPAAPAGDREPYTAPALTVFRDMEDILAFDPPLPQPGTVWTARPDAP
jgi:hypothetical protein